MEAEEVWQSILHHNRTIMVVAEEAEEAVVYMVDMAETEEMAMAMIGPLVVMVEMVEEAVMAAMVKLEGLQIERQSTRLLMAAKAAPLRSSSGTKGEQ